MTSAGSNAARGWSYPHPSSWPPRSLRSCGARGRAGLNLRTQRCLCDSMRDTALPVLGALLQLAAAMFAMLRARSCPGVNFANFAGHSASYGGNYSLSSWRPKFAKLRARDAQACTGRTSREATLRPPEAGTVPPPAPGPFCVTSCGVRLRRWTRSLSRFCCGAWPARRRPRAPASLEFPPPWLPAQICLPPPAPADKSQLCGLASVRPVFFELSELTRTCFGSPRSLVRPVGHGEPVGFQAERGPAPSSRGN